MTLTVNRLALAVLLTGALILVGISAYQWGQYGTVALSLRGISVESGMAILWKAVLGGAFLSWRLTGGTFSFLFPQSQKA